MTRVRNNANGAAWAITQGSMTAAQLTPQQQFAASGADTGDES